MHTPVGISWIVAGSLLSRPGSLGAALFDRLEAVPAVWKARRRQRVAWIPSALPDGEEAEAIREAITMRGLGTYGEVTRYVADRLFRRDRDDGGWLADIGLFHPWYLWHACETVDRLRGKAVAVDEEEIAWS
jgi:hypothetical protein